MKIILSGINGAMGKIMTALVTDPKYDTVIAYGVDINTTGSETIPTFSRFDDVPDGADCIIDFSHHCATAALTDFAIQRRLPLVIATTGQTEDELQMIRSASREIPVFFAANYSMGIALLIRLAKQTAAAMPGAEIEIIEKHHNRKADAPSGTALAIANAIREIRPESEIHCGRSGSGKRKPEEIGIHSIRMGNIVGEHEVIIGTDSQTLTLKHEAHSRALFAEGALDAAKFLLQQPDGLYDMDSILHF